jgi:hypothetical protein
MRVWVERERDEGVGRERERERSGVKREKNREG